MIIMVLLALETYYTLNSRLLKILCREFNERENYGWISSGNLLMKVVMKWMYMPYVCKVVDVTLVESDMGINL